VARTKRDAKAPTPPGADGPKSGRVTYFIPTSLAEKVRDIAWWDRESVNSVVVQALEDLVAKRERKRGEPYPRREKPLPGGGL
jgi:hypothetical protein